MKKVIVFGTFDIVHPGHLHLLKSAKEYGDYLVVVIARDDTVCMVKHKAPKNTETVRLKQIEELNIADKVRLGCLDDKYSVLREEMPDIIALGYDQTVFVENLEKSVPPNTTIVRIGPFKPEIYKSSLLSS